MMNTEVCAKVTVSAYDLGYAIKPIINDMDAMGEFVRSYSKEEIEKLLAVIKYAKENQGGTSNVE